MQETPWLEWQIVTDSFFDGFMYASFLFSFIRYSAENISNPNRGEVQGQSLVPKRAPVRNR